MNWIKEQIRILSIAFSIIKKNVLTVMENGGHTEQLIKKDNGYWQNIESNEICSQKELCVMLIMLDKENYNIKFTMGVEK